MSPSRRRRRASPEWEGRDVITVAALPGRGLFVRHLGHPEGVDGVHRPTVPPPGAPPRPPAVFDAAWITEHADDLDVVHVHGLPHGPSPADVDAAAAAAREAGLPLVVTVYHLTDPAGGDEGRYADQLGALLRNADAVTTLTRSAADDIDQRFGIEAGLLPHPHVVDFVRMRRERPGGTRSAVLVGTSLGSLRMPGDPVAFVQALADATRAAEGTRLIVHLHEHLLDPDSTRYEPDTIRAIQKVVENAGGVIRAHRPMTDPQLWDHLFSLDVSVLPPLHGSHSIWPEACYDLGTRLVMPGDTHAAQQKPVFTYRGGTDGVDATSLATAVAAAKDEEAALRADPSERWKERVGVSESLRSLYERLIAKR